MSSNRSNSHVGSWLYIQNFWDIATTCLLGQTLRLLVRFSEKELCSFLNNYYQVNTFKPEDYGVCVYIFGGFYIYNKKSKEVIANSPDMKSKFLEIKLDKMQSKEFPKSQLVELNKFFTVDENISLACWQ